MLLQCASITQRLKQQPCNISIDWDEYRVFLNGRYTKQYANMQFNNARRYLEFFNNPSRLLSCSPYSRLNALKSLVCLSKYIGCHVQFKEKLKQYGIKWMRPDCFSSFMRIMNNNHKDLIEWYKRAYSILDENEKLYLKFMLLSGLRKTEGMQAFNLIIELHKENRLSEYFSEELSMLEHYEYKQFLRNTKNAYITIIPKDLVMQIANSKPASYNAIHCYLMRKRINLRIKELRSYYASFRVRHNIISEEVDILQGRVPKSVFARHYLKENPAELGDRTLTAITQLERTLN
jgi:intergrase/recombinase